MNMAGVTPEATTRGVLWKKVFLEILQNSQESTCVRVSFLIKLQAWGLRRATLLKKGRVFSCEFYETSKNSFFYRIPLVAASEDYFLWRGFESVRAQWTNCFNIFMIKISCLYEKKSSHRRCSVRKDVLRNFTKFTGNTCARVSGCNFFTEHFFYRTPLEECF